MMIIAELANRLVESAKDATVNYTADPARLESHKSQLVVGAIATGVAHIIPGSHPIIENILLGYTVLKGYQSLRDWAGR
ncbi:MAG: hypothetical protein KJ709_01225 [Nanoarchaeota archaeon]|nr:hypothetical protein [Nanoarchaeota archaeon]